MTNLIFCLSMPGGHMTYIALLAKLLLQHLPVKYDYIDNAGSAHNAEKFLPPHLEFNFVANWDRWLKSAIDNYTQNNICVIKDGWGSTDLNVWEEKLNSIDNNICIISSPISKVDWYYCWLNYGQKVPLGLYGQLKVKNVLLPIWHMLNNKHKLKSFSKSMPVFPLKENLKLQCNTFRFPTTDILDVEFPSKLANFLKNHNTLLSKEIIEFHNYFISKQLQNYNLSVKLANNERWEPRNLFDKILFDWIDTNPWEE